MTSRRAVAAGTALLCATLLLPWTDFGQTETLGDVRHYHRFAEAMLDGRIPYHNFFMEYPPGAIPIFLAPEAAGHAVAHYGLLFQWLVVALIVVTIVVVSKTIDAVGGTPRRQLAAAVLIGASPALLGSVYFRRYDILAATVTSLAVLAMVRRRENTAAALLAVGAAAKFYPVVLLPLLVAQALGQGRTSAIRVAAVFGGVFAVIVAPFAIVAPGGVAFSFRVQLTRALEIESLGGVLLMCAHRLGIYDARVYAGLAFELLGSTAKILGALQTALLVAGLLWIWWIFYRSRRSDEVLLLASAAAVAVTVTFNKVLSPQYLIWLVPLVAQLGRRTGAFARGLLATTMVLTVWYFPGRFRDLRQLGGSAWIVLIRNAVLLALVVFLIWALRRAVRRERTYEIQPPVAPL